MRDTSLESVPSGGHVADAAGSPTRALVLATISFALSFAAWGLVGGLASVFTGLYRLTASETAFLVAVPVLLGSLARLPMGMLTDRFGGRLVFTALLAFSSLAAFVVPLTGSYGSLLVAAFLIGMAGIVLRGRRRLRVPLDAGGSAGHGPRRLRAGDDGAIAGRLRRPAGGGTLGWEAVFRGTGALLLVWAVAYFLLARNPPQAGRPATVAAMMAVLRRAPTAWLLGAFYFLTFGGFVAFSIYLPTLLRAQFGLAPADAGFRAAGFVVLATLMRPVGGWLADRIGGAQVLSWVFGGVALFSLLLTWPSMVPFTVGALGCAMLMGLGNGAVFKLVPEHFPKDTGTVTGLVGALGGLGGFFPPLLLGVFRDRLGVIWPGFLLLSATALAAARGQPARLPPRRRRVDAVPAGGRASGARACQSRRVGRRSSRPRWRRRSSSGRATCSTSTRRSSATRSRRSSPRSASATATRCGCSVRRRACTGGAGGRRSSHGARWPATRSVSDAARCVEFAANAYIFRRGRLRGLAHWLIMWGCLLAAAITFPLVWGWIHFETVPGDLHMYRTFVFGIPMQDFPVESAVAFVIFHGLVWSSFLVIAGVMLAFRRRMIDHGAVAVQQFGQDILPLLLLFAISVTGLMLTASYTWMRGYAYEFLAILHAATVIVTLLWLPFGKLFHVFQRPAQLGVGFYKDAGARGEQAACRRCGQPYASLLMVRDLITVEQELGFRYELPGGGHYQEVCPRCRRALFGLAQGALWQQYLNAAR